jgi:NAD(P)-dependent dehydrogenase (short-subunit alcohol dehydrogenase family)
MQPKGGIMRALVIGASGGIGAALAARLARLGQVVTLSRQADGLDVTDEPSVQAALAGLKPGFDLILVASGILSGANGPEKSIKQFDASGFMGPVLTNALGPMLVLKHALRLIPRDKRCVFAVLSAKVGSIGDNRLGGWYSYRASKAALNQLIHGAAVEIARTHPQAVLALLHPGTVDTPFTANYAPPYEKLSADDAAGRLLAVLDGLTPAQSGGFFDYAGAELPW